MAVNPRKRYTCVYQISLSAGMRVAARRKDFEHSMVNEVMPKTLFPRRYMRFLNLEHRLLQDISKQHGTELFYQYSWQIRVLDYADFSNQEPTDYNRLFTTMDEDVRDALAPWGKVHSKIIFEELGDVSVR